MLLGKIQVKSIFCIGVVVMLTVSVLAVRAEAGSANADLHCVSKNKKVTVSGSIPGDFAEFELEFEENGTVMTMTDDPAKSGKDRVFVHEDFKKGVFAVAVGHPERPNFLLYGVPRSVRKSAKRTLKKFKAVLQTAPRPSLKEWNDASAYFDRLPMSCTYKYEI